MEMLYRRNTSTKRKPFVFRLYIRQVDTRRLVFCTPATSIASSLSSIKRPSTRPSTFTFHYVDVMQSFSRPSIFPLFFYCSSFKTMAVIIIDGEIQRSPSVGRRTVRGKRAVLLILRSLPITALDGSLPWTVFADPPGCRALTKSKEELPSRESVWVFPLRPLTHPQMHRMPPEQDQMLR